MLRTYWHAMANMPGEDVAGKLIVLEGTDGVGRSTQTAMLKSWLESTGLAVHDTGLTRSILAGRDLQEAKLGHTMGVITQALYYATDFADRLENEMIPALRAGYVVLTDRYIYSLIARAIVRGADPQWMRKVYGFAVVPDLIIYLQADLRTLIPRVLARGGFDFWESGADYIRATNRFDSFVEHQDAMLGVFSRMTTEYGFTVVDANRPVKEVYDDLRAQIRPVIADMQPGAEPPLQPGDEVIPPLDREEPQTRSVSAILADLLEALKEQ
jgi:dTMP kinase